MQLTDMLRELRKEKKRRHIVPEVILLTTIRNRYGKDPLPELRSLWAKGLVKNCKLLNDLGFYYYGE